ncbi:MAG: hypothetical protein KA327_11800 [Pseudarcicella sp.]|nr:hypothetical protein [Pseudarcicella sp.]
MYDWYYFTKKNVPVYQINKCFNELTLEDINASSSNLFVKYLFENKHYKAIEYLKIAKKCEEFNNLITSDEWDKNENPSNRFIDSLHQKIQSENNFYFKRKYAFQAIRTAYYLEDYATIHNFFETYFSKGKKDYLYYWSLYFDNFKQSNSEVNIANVMAYSYDKKIASFYHFHEKFDLEKALKQSQSPSDIANSYAYVSLQKAEPNIENLKKIYSNSNHSRILSFLLLREINKVEDWIFTPYYTNYLPAVNISQNDSDNAISTSTLRLRSEKDRIYAKEILNFVDSVNLKNVENPVLWKIAKIQLLFMTKQYDACVNKINELEDKNTNPSYFSILEKIKILATICNQPSGKAIVPKAVQSLVLKYKNDAQFMFSVGRELEFLGNKSDGIALTALCSHRYSTLEESISNNVNWQENRNARSGNLKYFNDYFLYLDFVYDSQTLQSIVNKLDNTEFDDFEKEVYSQLMTDKNYLLDLLGTKYLRENNLAQAEKTLKSIPEKYWAMNYNAWESDKFGEMYSFEKNPFYDFNYTPNFIKHETEIMVTKLAVIQQLKKYISIANNPKTKDRAYFYSLIANCYYNMSSHGNAWMMRRFESTGYDDSKPIADDSYTDENEYRTNVLAQNYYQLAHDNAKTPQFKAYCMRMKEFSAKGFNNSSFKETKKMFPQFANELSSCNSLASLFSAR